MNAFTTQIQRTVPQLYRDCLRLVRHVAPGQTAGKALALRSMVRSEFRKPLGDNAQEVLESRKANAIRALSNYMLTVAAPKDEKLKTVMKSFHGRSVQQAKQTQQQQQRQQQRQKAQQEQQLKAQQEQQQQQQPQDQGISETAPGPAESDQQPHPERETTMTRE
ncbi:hypothetical protein ACA910_018943 [Epithemia clementina (nom. ined.)]